jgi:hypothetical protein
VFLLVFSTGGEVVAGDTVWAKSGDWSVFLDPELSVVGDAIFVLELDVLSVLDLFSSVNWGVEVVNIRVVVVDGEWDLSGLGLWDS